jgi:hypothetical protein
MPGGLFRNSYLRAEFSFSNVFLFTPGFSQVNRGKLGSETVLNGFRHLQMLLITRLKPCVNENFKLRGDSLLAIPGVPLRFTPGFMLSPAWQADSMGTNPGM